jgi:tRNA pseudouridine55 synthase
MTEVAHSEPMLASGLLAVDKPRGVTSHDIVAAARAALHTKHVGHAGTLDPMATGLLIVGFGSATRLLSYIVGIDKTYETVIRLGQSTTTDDADGEFLEQSDDERHMILARLSALSDADIIAAAAALTGSIMQVPSAYSAKKIHGQKAYDLARNGQDVHLEPVPVTVSAFDILGIERHLDSPHDGFIDVSARVTCSAGTYIRSLGRDMGAALGTGAHLVSLRRTRVGSFDVTNPDVVSAHAQDHTFVNRQGETVTHPWAVFDDPAGIRAHAISPAAGAAQAMPTIDISAQQADDLRHGRFIEGVVHGPTAAIMHPDLSRQSGDTAAAPQGDSGGMGDMGNVDCVSSVDGVLVAIVERRTKKLLKPSVVF